MTYASIMVGLDRSSASRGRTKIAAHIAERFQARLIGITARRPDYISEYGETAVLSEPAMEEIRDVAFDDISAVEGAFRTIVGEGARIEFRSALNDPEVFLEEQSRAADVVVLGRPMGKDLADPRMSLSAGMALMAIGRPVLVVPPGVDHLPVKRVVIAWKNTAQTRRAISDAMPLLKIAQQVQVVRIADDDDQDDLRDVVRFLGLHNVNATCFRRSADGGGVALALQKAAKAFDADLIVSGAYGHNRIREWLFGGVTRELLGAFPICCMMSH